MIAKLISGFCISLLTLAVASAIPSSYVLSTWRHSSPFHVANSAIVLYGK
jgi:hypothetical protein